MKKIGATIPMGSPDERGYEQRLLVDIYSNVNSGIDTTKVSVVVCDLRVSITPLYSGNMSVGH